MPRAEAGAEGAGASGGRRSGGSGEGGRRRQVSNRPRSCPLVANRSWGWPAHYSGRRAGGCGEDAEPGQNEKVDVAGGSTSRSHRPGRSPQRGRRAYQLCCFTRGRGLCRPARAEDTGAWTVCVRVDGTWGTCSFLASDSGVAAWARERRLGRKEEFVHFAPLSPRFPSPKRRQRSPRSCSPLPSASSGPGTPRGDQVGLLGTGVLQETRRGAQAGRTLPAWRLREHRKVESG